MSASTRLVCRKPALAILLSGASVVAGVIASPPAHALHKREAHSVPAYIQKQMQKTQGEAVAPQPEASDKADTPPLIPSLARIAQRPHSSSELGMPGPMGASPQTPEGKAAMGQFSLGSSYGLGIGMGGVPPMLPVLAPGMEFVPMERGTKFDEAFEARRKSAAPPVDPNGLLPPVIGSPKIKPPTGKAVAQQKAIGQKTAPPDSGLHVVILPPRPTINALTGEGFGGGGADFGHFSIPHPTTMRGVRMYDGLSSIPNQGFTTQEDMPRIAFEACVRVKLNAGEPLTSAFGLCEKASPGYAPPDIPHPQEPGKELASPQPPPQQPARRAANTDRDTEPFDGAGSLAAAAEARRVWERGLSSAPAPGGYKRDCDVSRDPSVLLDRKCLQEDENALATGMMTASGDAPGPHFSPKLHIPHQSADASASGTAAPSGMTDTPLDAMQAGPGQRHALLAAIPARRSRDMPDPSEFEDDAEDDGAAVRRMDRQARRDRDSARQAEAREAQAAVKCEWGSRSDDAYQMTYGHEGAGSIKACVHDALGQAPIVSGVISITLTNKATRSKAMVECHRRSGRDVCAAL